MMQAWDLDKDTHSLFRQYLDVAIKRRKALQGFKEIVMDPSVRMYLSKKGNSGARASYYNTCAGFGRDAAWIESGERSMFNELRVSLPNRVLGGGRERRGSRGRRRGCVRSPAGRSASAARRPRRLLPALAAGRRDAVLLRVASNRRAASERRFRADSGPRGF